MEKPDVGAIAATVVAGAAAETLWNQLGVVAVGALGGAFWALMQIERIGNWSFSLRFIAPRAIFSFCLSWVPAIMLQEWLNDHSYKVPLTIAMLSVSFFLACPRELVREMPPLIRLILRIKE